MYGSTVTAEAYTDADCTTALKGTAIEPGADLTFYVRYSIKNIEISDARTLLTYEFGVHTQSAGVAAAEGALTKFKDILNDPVDYDALNTGIEEGYFDRGYVGNVTGSFLGGVVDGWITGESELVEGLFEDRSRKGLCVIIQAAHPAGFWLLTHLALTHGFQARQQGSIITERFLPLI